MTDPEAAEAVAWYLDGAREGDDDAAFHGLRELPDEALAAIEAAYRVERDPALRGLLVAVVGERRPALRLDFLAEALDDPEPAVWKRALDALVALASPPAAEIVRRAIPDSTDAERRGWLEEARGQIDAQAGREG